MRRKPLPDKARGLSPERACDLLRSPHAASRTTVRGDPALECRAMSEVILFPLPPDPAAAARRMLAWLAALVMPRTTNRDDEADGRPAPPGGARAHDANDGPGREAEAHDGGGGGRRDGPRDGDDRRHTGGDGDGNGGGNGDGGRDGGKARDDDRKGNDGDGNGDGNDNDDAPKRKRPGRVRGRKGRAFEAKRGGCQCRRWIRF